MSNSVFTFPAGSLGDSEFEPMEYLPSSVDEIGAAPTFAPEPPHFAPPAAAPPAAAAPPVMAPPVVAPPVVSAPPVAPPPVAPAPAMAPPVVAPPVMAPPVSAPPVAAPPVMAPPVVPPAVSVPPAVAPAVLHAPTPESLPDAAPRALKVTPIGVPLTRSQRRRDEEPTQQQPQYQQPQYQEQYEEHTPQAQQPVAPLTPAALSPHAPVAPPAPAAPTTPAATSMPDFNAVFEAVNGAASTEDALSIFDQLLANARPNAQAPAPAPTSTPDPTSFDASPATQVMPVFEPAPAAEVASETNALDAFSALFAEQAPSSEQLSLAEQSPLAEQAPAPAAAPAQQPTFTDDISGGLFTDAAGESASFSFTPGGASAEVDFAPEGDVVAEFSPNLSAAGAQPEETAPLLPPAFESRRDLSLSPDAELDAALEQVVASGASDLHVSANAVPMLRIDGGLRPLPGASVWDAEKVTAALLTLLQPAQKERFDEMLEFDFAYTLSPQARFRVNFYQQRENMGAAFRLIPTGIKSLRSLGVPEVVGDFAKLARGLVLVTGPTGSGKSTTLAGLIDVVNRTRADHIMTVEDPIEFLHTNHKSLVNQREVGHDTHSFQNALKHVLRQDPDVILVGELRDLETISVALTAAETGHLVFATLHTQDAAQTIDRIIDVYPPHQQGQVRAQLAATLQGVVCQTLVKRASGSGRVVATEVLVGTHAIANLIREGKTYQIASAMQAGRDLGMHTMDQHLADLVNTGQITLLAAQQKAQDLEVLARLVTRTVDTAAGGSQPVNFGDDFSATQF